MIHIHCGLYVRLSSFSMYAWLLQLSICCACLTFLIFGLVLQTRNGGRVVPFTSWIWLLALWGGYQYTAGSNLISFVTSLCCSNIVTISMLYQIINESYVVLYFLIYLWREVCDYWLLNFNTMIWFYFFVFFPCAFSPWAVCLILVC